MPNFEPYCRCPGCGTCGAHDALRVLVDAVDSFSAELVKSRGILISAELAEASNTARAALENDS